MELGGGQMLCILLMGDNRQENAASQGLHAAAAVELRWSNQMAVPAQQQIATASVAHKGQQSGA